MSEKKTQVRYPRPILQIEVDLQTLTQPGCCRFVPILIRLINIPRMEVTLDVTFWRERMRDLAGEYTEGYQTQPRFCHPPAKNAESVDGVWEIRTELLARSHDFETGTVSITMSSYSSTELSHAEYRLVSCRSALTEVAAKGFASITIFDHLLSTEERTHLDTSEHPPAQQTLLL